jgi:hypothetical protein
MSKAIGDGMAALALVAGILGYLWIRFKARQHKLDIIHKERLVAMEKGIPLPEFPLEEPQERRADHDVIPILGMVLATLSVGAMIVLFMSEAPNRFWIAPLPFAFLGIGFLAYHLLTKQSR